MASWIKCGDVALFSIIFLSFSGVSFAEIKDVETRESLDIQCGEVKMRITVKRQFFQDRGVPFKPEYLRLGGNLTRKESCGPKGPLSDGEMVISAGLQECGTESHVHSEWLVYSNKLHLLSAVLHTSTGSVIIKGATTIIPVECHYKRKQKVTMGLLSPTWVPLTSTINVFGFLRFSLRFMTGQTTMLLNLNCISVRFLCNIVSNWSTYSNIMSVCSYSDGCTSRRSPLVYQQGEAVFLEASVDAPLHPPLTIYVDSCVATLKPDHLSLPSYKFLTKHGCLVDSLLPGSPSKFFPREQNNRLCFSVQAFQFNQKSGEQMFISCHLKATLTQNSHTHLDKACFFHRPSFSWRATEGDSSLCECCDSVDCSGMTAENRSGHAGPTTQPETGCSAFYKPTQCC
ncbi:zona pellucida sperm-binding protein 3-like [Acanthochromis polyacanthus]|uniref:zona pellucida sperm-binding protein 3-like n=1 Tax=Acanthochromis polyacanthus TaxID=80966 RepID=UPI002233FAC0|nr:zona pellucida sperm-binding protein 3-like [Acanthochromis polyacanthus]